MMTNTNSETRVAHQGGYGLPDDKRRRTTRLCCETDCMEAAAGPSFFQLNADLIPSAFPSRFKTASLPNVNQYHPFPTPVVLPLDILVLRI